MKQRERKELACGTSSVDAIAAGLDAGIQYDANKHDLEQDLQTKVWSIYHKRRASDRTIKRPISRVARAPYSNGYGRDRRPVVVTLLPRELIETRLKGTRRRYSISWDDLHAYLVRRHALAVLSAKQKERAARRKERQAQRKRARR
jgi:hypothetical protein